MKQNGRLLFWVFSLSAILAACGTASTPTPPTPIPINETSSLPRSPSSTPADSENCQSNQTLLAGLAASLPFEQNEVMHQSYAREDSLVIWLVSTEINQVAFEQKPSVAEQQAIMAANLLFESSNCIRNFNTMQFIVVDEAYQLWFSGSLRTRDIPELQAEQAGGGTDSPQGGGRQQPVASTPLPADASNCTWPDVAVRLKDKFSSQNADASFYFVRDTGGSNIYTQWAVPDSEAALNVIDSVSQIAAEIGCLNPPADGISVLLTLTDGQTLLSGYLPLGDNGGFDPAKFSYNFIDQP